MLGYILILYLLYKVSAPVWLMCVCTFAIGGRLISWAYEEGEKSK